MQSNSATQTVTPVNTAKPARRYDIDWLRVLAVLLLFPFHTARVFDTFSEFYAKNSELSEALTYFIAYVHPWHMPLLFLLAGASSWFALEFRSGRQYIRERFIRLLVPFIFGLLVILPPQSYFGLVGHSGFSGSFLEWYPNFFKINPSDIDGYYLGGFTLGHLWFIIFLFVFSLIALPLFLWLKRNSGKRIAQWIAVFCSIPGLIFLLGLPLYLMYRLIDFYPSPLYFIAYFILGYILVADDRFGKSINQHKAIALVLGPVLYLIIAYFNLFSWPIDLPKWTWPIFRAYDQGFAAWFFMIAILGYGRMFLKTSNKFLQYTGQASYPIYILHQTVIVIIGFYIVQLNAGVWLKFITILVSSVILSTIIYELLIKRFNAVRFLFGMRLKRIQHTKASSQ
jgi:glucan biosynthesis protein C